MVIILSNNYSNTLKVINSYISNMGIEFVGLELEYGKNVITEKQKGISMVCNHHSQVEDKDKKYPCLAYKYIYKDNKRQRYNNFILSHFDLDVIFGIGWLSGIFPDTKEFVEMSNTVQLADQGFPIMNDKKYHKIRYLVNIFKKNIIISPDGIANIKEIVLGLLVKIKDVIFGDISSKVEKKNTKVEKLNVSTKQINVYGKKYNDYYREGNNFIICKTSNLSVYVDPIFAEQKDIDISKVLQEYFGEEAGGTKTAGGAPRQMELSMGEFYKFIKWFKKYIKKWYD